MSSIYSHHSGYQINHGNHKLYLLNTTVKKKKSRLCIEVRVISCQNNSPEVVVSSLMFKSSSAVPSEYL